MKKRVKTKTIVVSKWYLTNEGFVGGWFMWKKHVMQSSPFVQCMSKEGHAPAVCGLSTGPSQSTCVGVCGKSNQDGAGTGRGDHVMGVVKKEAGGAK